MMTMSASAQVYKIDNVDIYSFGTLESLKEFVAKQKLTGYESKVPPPPTKTSKCSSSSSSQPQTRYNTRRSKLKRLPASSESSFSPSSSSSYEDKITEGCVKPSSSPLSSSEERESGIGSSSSTHSSSWLDDDCSTLDDYLIKLDECLPVSSPRTLNDESHLDMNLDESTTTTTTPPPPPTSSSKRNGDSTSDDDEIMVWEPNANSPTCGKAHCRLGCICPPDESSSQPSQQQQQQTSSSPVSNKSTASSSSSATSMQSQHCGRYECMFECLCSRRLRSSTRSNRSTVANEIVLPPASEANATSSATSTYSIGTRRREASVSSTNSIFSNSSLPYASNSRSSQLCKSPKSFRDDYYYYDRTTTNLGVSSSPSKYLNNSKSQRQNNSNQTSSNSNMTASKQTGKTTPTQQQQQPKAAAQKIQPKPVAATKTNTVTAEFKPYTHRMLLQAKPMLIAGKQSILNDIPLIIEVFTAKWKREPPIAKKCLKLLWKLLNVLAYQSVNWREIEFDYERELTVRLAAVSEKSGAARSSPIRVRIMKFTPTKPANEDGSKFREIPKGLSGLQNGRYIVRECDNIPLKISFKENRPQQQLDLVKKEKPETNELVASPHFKENFFFPKSTIVENSVSALCQSFSPVKSTSTEAASSLNWSSPKGRYLPRVLCRSRPSHNQSSSSSSSSNNSPSNRTSEIFKSLDTLFEKNNIYARHNQPQEPVKKEKPLMDSNYHEACQLVDSEEIVKSVNDLLNDLVSTVAAATSLPSPQLKKDIIVLNKNSENSNTNNQSNALVRKVVQLVKPPILKSSFLPIKPKPSQTTQPIYKVSLLPTPIMNKVRTGPVKIAPRPPSWSSSDHSSNKRDFSELNENEREEYLAHRKRKRKQDLSAIPSGRISANLTHSPSSTTTTTTLRLVDVAAASYDDSSSISSSNLSSPNAVAVVATATSSSSNTNTSIKTQSSPLIISTSSLFKSRGQTSSSARKSSYSDNTSEENSNNMTQEDLDEEEDDGEEINYEDEEIDELEMDLDDEEGENDAQQLKQGRGRGRPRRDESLSLSLSSAPRNRSSISCSYSSDSDGEEGEGSKSGGEYRKTIPPNIHSLRERERRSRLKTLLTKLQLAFLESSEESESPGEWLIKANRMFKVRASKQAILHEAVHQIKVAERNERLLQQEREAELRRNISLKNILQSLTNRA